MSHWDRSAALGSSSKPAGARKPTTKVFASNSSSPAATSAPARYAAHVFRSAPTPPPNPVPAANSSARKSRPSGTDLDIAQSISGREGVQVSARERFKALAVRATRLKRDACEVWQPAARKTDSPFHVPVAEQFRFFLKIGARVYLHYRCAATDRDGDGVCRGDSRATQKNQNAVRFKTASTPSSRPQPHRSTISRAHFVTASSRRHCRPTRIPPSSSSTRWAISRTAPTRPTCCFTSSTSVIGAIAR